MWVNNSDDNNMVTERLDRFLISTNSIDNLHFLATNVVRKANFDHDAILMDTMDQKPRGEFKDPRLFFKFDVCWVKENEDIIKKAWSINDTNFTEKLEKVHEEISLWQHGRYRRIKNRICKLVVRIDKLIDGLYEEFDADMLKTIRLKQGHLYAEEESY
ncbi:hypothetical protein GOBAR_DD03730 [Gossypium barbadense]|nr:hypothetical protein GOBAR_DD03730 [Gossypium barbadense]